MSGLSTYNNKGIEQNNYISNDDVADSNKSNFETKTTKEPIIHNIPKDDDDMRAQLRKAANSSSDYSDPLHILKIRFAKGEISSEEYEQMRKIIES
jgi:hypothetical protein